MELKDFIGKVVIGKENRWRYTLYRIDAAVYNLFAIWSKKVKNYFLTLEWAAI